MRRATVLRLLWAAYLAWYAVALVTGMLGARVVPWVAALGLVPAAILHLLVARRVAPRASFAILAGAVVQFAIGQLLLGGSGSTWRIGPFALHDPPGVPPALTLAAFALGMLLPPALAALGWRSARRAGAAPARPLTADDAT